MLKSPGSKESRNWELVCTEVPSQMINGLFNETLVYLLVFCIVARVFMGVKLRCKLVYMYVVEAAGNEE